MEIEIPLPELEAELEITLRSLRLPFRKAHLVRDVSAQLVVDDFGVVVSALLRSDYGFVNKAVREHFPDYRYVYVSTFDSIIEKRDEIIWTLMRGGYMKFIRINFPRQFQQLITDNFGAKIIRERLRRWDNRPKFRFLIEENEKAKDIPITMILATEPAFFDYMP